MICRNCGNNIDNRAICPYCGMQNQQVQTVAPVKVSKKKNMGPIIIMMSVVVMAVAIFFMVNMGRIKEVEVEDDSSSNGSNVINSSSNSSNSTNPNGGPVANTLSCIEKVIDEYGETKNTYEYVFKSDQLYSYKMTRELKLNEDFYSYRDILLQQVEREYTAYTSVSGIDIDMQRVANGFTYTLRIKDTAKVDREKLNSLNIYSISYSDVITAADENGLTCK